MICGRAAAGHYGDNRNRCRLLNSLKINQNVALPYQMFSRDRFPLVILNETYIA